MGVFADAVGDPRAFSFAEAARQMRPILYSTFNARLRFYEPNRSSAPAYDPLNDTGGVGVRRLLFDTGENGAIVQPVRSPSELVFGEQKVGISAVTLQTKREVDPTILRSGLVIQVVNGGEAPELEAYLFSLKDGIDASNAWGRIMEASVVGANVGQNSIPIPGSGYGTSPYGTEGYGL